jgi:hypothetical protein
MQPWRFISQASSQILVPPDLAGADVTQRTLKTDLTPGGLRCQIQQGGIALRSRGKRGYITINRDSLAQQPSGWLGSWATQLEQQQCVAPGGGMDLAVRIADSVPLDPRTSLHLLYGNELQTGELPLTASSRIRLTSPLWQIPGVGLMAEGPYEVAGHGYSLTVTGKSTQNLVGYETSIYAVRPRPGAVGFTIAPVYADQSVDGATERKPKPTVNLLDFPVETAVYKVFYKSWTNEFTAIVVGARTPAELARRIETLRTSGASASCETLGDKMCVALPTDIGLAVLVAVTVNGSEVNVNRGGTLFSAIAASGEKQPDRVLPTLKVFRPWNNRSVAVAFNRDDGGILKLVLSGGEVISWLKNGQQ